MGYIFKCEKEFTRQKKAKDFPRGGGVNVPGINPQHFKSKEPNEKITRWRSGGGEGIAVYTRALRQVQ